VSTLSLSGSLLDSRHLIEAFGLLGLVVIVFAECGLLVGFFLPGDTLLFTAGVLVSTGTLSIPLWVVILVLFAAAVAGNECGYAIGYRTGPVVFRRPEGRFFRQEHVGRARAFFDRYGVGALVLGRFVPVVRTFITVMAGVSRMPHRVYLLCNLASAALWAGGVTLLGYFLGHVAFIADHVELLVIGGVLVAALPIGFALLRQVGHRTTR
jgi:membrane-associated protein